MCEYMRSNKSKLYPLKIWPFFFNFCMYVHGSTLSLRYSVTNIPRLGIFEIDGLSPIFRSAPTFPFEVIPSQVPRSSDCKSRPGIEKRRL